jgi:hypothetical protein
VKVHYDSPEVMPCPVPTHRAFRDLLEDYQEALGSLGEEANGDIDAMIGPALEVGLLRERLTLLVLVANGRDPEGRLTDPVAVDLGETLLVVSEHPDDECSAEAVNGPVLTIVPQTAVVALT